VRPAGFDTGADWLESLRFAADSTARARWLDIDRRYVIGRIASGAPSVNLILADRLALLAAMLQRATKADRAVWCERQEIERTGRNLACSLSYFWTAQRRSHRLDVDRGVLRPHDAAHAWHVPSGSPGCVFKCKRGAVLVRSMGERDGQRLDDRQVHVFQVESEQVVEVWQFVGDGPAVADFWH